MGLLKTYLEKNDTNISRMHEKSGLPVTTLRNIDKKHFEKWTLKQFDAISLVVNKSREDVISELENLSELSSFQQKKWGRYDLQQRRYIGNKSKLLNWIKKLIIENTNGNSFFDVFAGTGVVTRAFLDSYDELIMNDFLFSNNIIYKAFFSNKKYDMKKLLYLKDEYNSITERVLDDAYFEENYGGKFFSYHDAMIIGEIRERIEQDKLINDREKSILIASLLYSSDKIANTVGHYDAYRKKVDISNKFFYDLINPIDVEEKNILIYRKDANQLVREVSADIAFVDPPYNSRQYSRFYHVLEGITKWAKPQLVGVAMKPPEENMSDYSKVSAVKAFSDLINNMDVKYIAVTYNNTYNSKSSSSQNKITHEQLVEILSQAGKTKQFEIPFQFFNTGKTELKNHKEFLFITEVGVFDDEYDS